MTETSPQPRSGHYEGSAEFHDLFMADPWERLRPDVRSTFRHLGADATILEVGAGTGMGTRVIAADSGAAITAIEPSFAMRTALTLSIANDPSLIDRVTIVAGEAPGAIEDDDRPIDGFVCAHMIGHLDRDSRSRTFAALRLRMAPGAVGLITTPPDAMPTPAEIAEVREGARLLRTESFAETWRHVSRANLIDELGDAGLVCEPVSPRAGAVRARS